MLSSLLLCRPRFLHGINNNYNTVINCLSSYAQGLVFLRPLFVTHTGPPMLAKVHSIQVNTIVDSLCFACSAIPGSRELDVLNLEASFTQ